MLLSRISSVVSVAMMVLGPGMASGQEFPNRPIRIITSLPGGGSDFGARLIAQEITAPLGQPVIVENRPSNLTGESAMKALPDGYTLLVEGNSFYFAPLLQKTPYDVLRDFSPVTIGITKSGKLRALAVTSAQPSALLPGLPTVASFGLPGYDLSNRTGVFASGKPPKAVINRLNQEVVRAVNSPDIKAKFFAAGVEVNTDTPEESVATIRTEVARMAKVVKAAGMKIN